MPRKVRNGIKPRVMDERAYDSDVRRLFWNTYQQPLLDTIDGRFYDPERTLRTIEEIRNRVATDPDFGRDEAETAIAKINAYHREKFARILASVQIDGAIFEGALSANVTATLRTALASNISLIKGMSEGVAGFTAANINQIIEAAPFDLQAQQNQIEQLLRSKGGTDRYIKNRSKLITRDQNNKILGNLTEARHKEVGGKEYVWSTSVDERVRDNHGRLDGTKQSWSNPPTGGGTSPQEAGHPGSGIQCRCVANLVFGSES